MDFSKFEKYRIMDAGVAYYTSKNDFLDEINHVSRTLAKYGYRNKKNSVVQISDNELLMEYNTIFRKRMLKCQLRQDADNQAYSILLQQGDRNTLFRKILVLTILFGLGVALFFSTPNFLFRTLGIFGIIYFLFVLLAPSRYAIKSCKDFLSDLNQPCS